MARRKKAIQKWPITTRTEWLKQRQQDVTASVVGALFGVHPYETALSLWAEKTGIITSDIDSKVLRRGRLLEGAVAAAFAEENPNWTIIKANEYLRDPRIRLGGTPDFFCTDPAGKRVVLQAKTVAPQQFRAHWTEDTPPFWITLQCLTESHLDNADYGMIAALVVDGYHFDLHTYTVPRHAAGELRIRSAVHQFWQNVEADKPPPPADYARDSVILSMMFANPTPGKVIDMMLDNRMPQLLEAREELQATIKDAKAGLDRVDTEVKEKLGDAEAAIVPGWRLTWKKQHRDAYTVAASDFRVLRTGRQK